MATPECILHTLCNIRIKVFPDEPVYLAIKTKYQNDFNGTET